MAQGDRGVGVPVLAHRPQQLSHPAAPASPQPPPRAYAHAHTCTATATTQPASLAPPLTACCQVVDEIHERDRFADFLLILVRSRGLPTPREGGQPLCPAGPSGCSAACCGSQLLGRPNPAPPGVLAAPLLPFCAVPERQGLLPWLLLQVRDLLPSQPHLRVVLMSATLHVDLFSGEQDWVWVGEVRGFVPGAAACASGLCHLASARRGPHL